MSLTRMRASGARLWMIACTLASAMAPLAGSGVDWQMSGNDLTNDRNQPLSTPAPRRMKNIGRPTRSTNVACSWQAWPPST